MAEGTMERTEQAGALATVEKKGAAPVAFGAGKGLVPTDLDGAWRCAQLVARSGLAPKGIQTPEAILVAATMGAEIGLSFMQSLQNIAVINGRPSVWGDAALALVRGSGLCAEYYERVEGEGENMVAVAYGRRQGEEKGQEERFSVEDAKLANLWKKDGPWRQYPRRMLAMRARGFLLRNLWPDVLRGTITAEEAGDIPTFAPSGPGTSFDIVDDTPRPPQPAPAMPAAATTEAKEAEAPKAPAERKTRGRKADSGTEAAPQGAAPAGPQKEPMPPRFSPGEIVATQHGSAVILGETPQFSEANGYQYKVRRENDGAKFAGAEFWQYEKDLAPGGLPQPEPVADPAQEPPKASGSAFLFCRRDQRQVNALVCAQKCDDRDDCPEFRAYQDKTTEAAPAGLFG